MQVLPLKNYSRDGRPVGEVKSLKPYEADSGVGSHVRNLLFKRGISPHNEIEVRNYGERRYCERRSEAK